MVNIAPSRRGDPSVLWLCGSVRYLLSLTQWKRSELQQNGVRVNHPSPTMQLTIFVNIETRISLT